MDIKRRDKNEWMSILNSDIQSRNEFSSLAIIISSLSFFVIMMFFIYKETLKFYIIDFLAILFLCYVIYIVINISETSNKLVNLRKKVHSEELKNEKEIQTEYNNCFLKHKTFYFGIYKDLFIITHYCFTMALILHIFTH